MSCKVWLTPPERQKPSNWYTASLVATPRFQSFACRHTCNHPVGLRRLKPQWQHQLPSSEPTTLRRTGRVVYWEHARLIIWMRSVRISCGHHNSVWYRTGENCDWSVLESRARIRNEPGKSAYVERTHTFKIWFSHPTKYGTWAYFFNWESNTPLR